MPNMNVISINTDQYTDESIIEANAFLVQSMAGSELEYDTLDAKLDLSAYRPLVLETSGGEVIESSDSQVATVGPLIRVLVRDPSDYVYGSEILAYHDSALLGKFYMQSITRVGKFLWSVSAVSPVGVLDKTLHYGGIYSSGATVSSVLADILGGVYANGEIAGGVIPCTLNVALANQPVRGWLPVATRRKNLHQLLFAMGACVKKDENGDIFVTYLDPLSASTVAEIPDERIYTGGSVEFPDKKTTVIVLEHAFVQSVTDITETLYEGDIVAASIVSPTGVTRSGGMVIFSEPCYNLSATNASILESGVNWAILGAGTGVVLTGKKYSHTTREIAKTTAGVSASDENTIKVEDATLVSLLNSEVVAERLYSYHHDSNEVSMDIVASSDIEKAGDGVSFSDPFDDAEEGYLREINYSMSHILKGSTKITTDYVPTTGNKFSNVEIQVASGTWTVPAGVTEIRVVLIGPGGDGSEGAPGEDGEWGDDNSYGTPGAGGNGGDGGDGGKIYVKDLSVTPGETLTTAITATQSRITQGATTYSSGSGKRSAAGYTDLLNGNTFAVPGVSGIAGGSGNPNGEPVTWSGVVYYPGAKGNDGEW